MLEDRPSSPSARGTVNRLLSCWNDASETGWGACEMRPEKAHAWGTCKGTWWEEGGAWIEAALLASHPHSFPRPGAGCVTESLESSTRCGSRAWPRVRPTKPPPPPAFFLLSFLPSKPQPPSPSATRPYCHPIARVLCFWESLWSTREPEELSRYLHTEQACSLPHHSQGPRQRRQSSPAKAPFLAFLPPSPLSTTS